MTASQWGGAKLSSFGSEEPRSAEVRTEKFDFFAPRQLINREDGLIYPYYLPAQPLTGKLMPFTSAKSPIQRRT
jgi:hypothetical protein